MNKIYKAFFSKTKGCVVVASEAAKSQGKSDRKSILKGLVTFLGLAVCSGTVHAAFYLPNIVGWSGSRSTFDYLYLYDDNNTHIDLNESHKHSIDSDTVSVAYGNSYNGFYQQLANNKDAYFLEQIQYRGNDKYTVRFKKLVLGDDGVATGYTDEMVDFICQGEGCPIAEFNNSVGADITQKDRVLSVYQTLVQNSSRSYLSVSGHSSQGWEFDAMVSRKITGLADGEISATSYDAVNGKQLYELQQQIATGGNEYLSVNASDAEASPSTSAKAIGARSMAVGEKANAKGSHSSAVGYMASAEAANSVALGSKSTVLDTDIKDTDRAGVVSVGSSDGTTGFKRRIINVANGVNASDAATVGQVGTISRSNIKSSLENVLGVTVADDGSKMTAGEIGQTGKTTVSEAISTVKLSVDGKLDKNLSNLTDEGKTAFTTLAKDSVKVNAGEHVSVSSDADGYTVSVTADGTVKGDKDGHLVTGSTVATAIDTETRVANNGNYVQSTNSAAQNLSVLDNKIKANETEIGKKANSDASNIAVASWQSALGNGKAEEKNTGLVTGGTLFASLGTKADLSLGNLSEAGLQKITELSQASLKIVNGNHTTVTTGTDGGAVTYAVDVAADGTVKGANDSHLVTGKTVSDAMDAETRVANNGNYVLSANTAAQNLSVLDTQIHANADAIQTNKTDIGKKANNDASGINVDSWQTALGTGEATQGNTGLVTGDTLFDSLATKANNDATGIDVAAWQGTLGNGEAKENNAGLITGGTLYNSLAGKADLSLGNINEEGTNLITALAQGSLKVIDGTHTTVTTGKDGDKVTYAVNVTADGTVNGDKDNGIVTGSTVATAISNAFNTISTPGSDYQDLIRDQARQSVKVTSVNSDILSVTEQKDDTNHITEYRVGLSMSDAVAENDAKPISSAAVFKEFGLFANASKLTNENVQSWQQKLGNGTIEDNNAGLVTGGTVYDAINSTFGNLEGTTQGDAVKDLAQNAIVVKATDAAQFISVTKASDAENNLDTYSIGLAMADQIGGSVDGLVSSSMVFDEVRPSADGTVIKRNATTGANLTALDTGLAGLGTDFGNLSTTVTNLQSLQGLTTAGESVIKNLASSAFTLTAGEHIIANKSTSGDQATWTLSVDDSGKIEKDNNQLVTGQTVYDYMQDFATGAGFATVSGDNIEVDKWIAVLGTGSGSAAVSADNHRFITGAELFSEARVSADGSYVKGANTVAGNLTALDTQLGKVSGSVFDAEGNLALANRALDNLTAAGTERLKSAVGVIGDGSLITVTKSDSEDGNTRNYSLALKTTDNAADGENALVTSNTLDSKLQSQNTTWTQSLALKADANAGNLSQENILQWQGKLGTGLVAADNAGLVTGGVLFAEVRPSADGTYVFGNKTTAENLTSLDQGLVDLDNLKANVNADNIANYKSNWLMALGGSIGPGQDGLGFVTGNAVYAWGTPESRTQPYYAISVGNTVGQNLAALDDKLSSVEQLIPGNALDTSLGNLTEAGKGAIADIAYGSLNITGEGLITVTKGDAGFTIGGISAGEVAQNSAGLVTGDQVWDALQGISISEDSIQEAINNALTNNETFQNAVSEAVVNNSNVQVAINNALQSEQTLTNIAQNMKPVGEVAADDGRAVSGQNVFNYLHSNALGLGSGSTASGTNAFVFGQGSTVSADNAGAFGSGNSIAANNAYAFGNNNKIAAGADNSFAVGNNNTINESATNTFILGSNVTTSAQNAVILGAGSVGVNNAVSVGSDTVKRKIVNVAPGDVYAGSTDAVNGGQLYETQQAIVETSRSINQVAHTLKKDINRAAANAAAMAALQPLGLDDEHKWSAAAGVGNYSGEQALAVGVFYKPTENIMVNFAGSAATGGDAMVNAGIAYRFGAPSSYNSMSTSALKSKVVALSDHNRSLEMQLKSAQIREQSMAERVAKSQQELEDLKKEIEMMKRALGLNPKAMKTDYKTN